jgi:integrase
MRVLGIAFQWAIRRGRLENFYLNPAHELGMTAPPPRVRAGSREEIEHLVAVADLLGRPEIGDMIILGVWSGQRQSDRRHMTVASRQHGRIIFKQMKTGARVSIPEAPAVKARLAASEQRRREAGIINPHVVLDERRWTPFTQTHYAHVFNHIRQIAAFGQPSTATMPAIKPMPSLIGNGGEENPLSLRDQDLRDTAVTWLARAGCSIPEICAITGHSLRSATTIFKHYLVIDPALADTAMAKMVAMYDEEGEGK